jgi:hypothetical protein
MTNANRAALACLAAIAFSAVAAPSAEWITQGIPIPARRLIQNLETRLRSDRRNADLLTNLARLHSYTYATKSDTARQTNDGLFVEEPTTYMPASVSDPLNAQQRAEAARHLEWAIERYRQALEINDRHGIARLGLAWCLEWAGQTSAAIAEYRTAIEHSWPAESKLSPARAKPFVTAEAGGRLLKLLGPNADLDERRLIQHRINGTVPDRLRAITPIAVPLDAAWSPFAPPTHRAIFDADGSGVPRSWSWIPPAAAWLVYDDRDGRIESALQMFGTVTFWMFWETGYDALCSLDDSGDGMLTGAELEKLALWRDVNINGVSEAGEVMPLERHGIEALSCRHVVVPDEDSTVAAYSPHGVRYRDGSTAPTYDLVLRTSGEDRSEASSPGAQCVAPLTPSAALR